MFFDDPFTQRTPPPDGTQQQLQTGVQLHQYNTRPRKPQQVDTSSIPEVQIDPNIIKYARAKILLKEKLDVAGLSNIINDDNIGLARDAMATINGLMRIPGMNTDIIRYAIYYFECDSVLNGQRAPKKTQVEDAIKYLLSKRNQQTGSGIRFGLKSFLSKPKNHLIIPQIKKSVKPSRQSIKPSRKSATHSKKFVKSKQLK